ncbi:APC family permease [Anaeromyxobacter oryzae]|uniref:Amino acid transporter n=1 Tax=Anaeromyxobacter oryzae TaxID=2918170 RepID=A0ABM7WZE0_9BACT|nr:APC family permease [Anaeromyxobacter oryzae]BDG04821.1 amino acid transporter [Anaeromyxobacter oryzae]
MEDVRAEPGRIDPRGRRGSLRKRLLGAPRDLRDPRTYHAISLVALLAWVGLGADGLSSSAYGPDEAYRAIGTHHFLALALAAATAVTVLVISLAYSQIIARFPFGGGGYVVATRLLGPSVGVVSGAALLVDYVLTISVSTAAGGDAVWSFLPPAAAPYKVPAEALAIGLLVVLNLRGVRESVTVLAPIFGLFLVTHAILIFGAIGSHLGDVPAVASQIHSEYRTAVSTEGLAKVFGIFLLAYSMGAGTYTGIEAVSNGLQIMREPKVATARRTMTYMAVSLSITAGGILLAYLLFRAVPQEGKTMNAVLLERFAGGFSPGGVAIGRGFVVGTLAIEAALLFVAAQAGFLDGPRVMANMATDSWLPRRFAALSERLVTQDGVLLMGGASLATLVLTRGDITHLVTMYSINVFVTFSLSQAAMLRYWRRHRRPGRAGGFAIHGLAFVLCAGILLGVVWEKGRQGGWVTIVVTSLLVALCFAIRQHYRTVQGNLRRLDEIMNALPAHPVAEHGPLDPRRPTAVMLVGGYAGLGIHALLTVQRLFPGFFQNFLFVSVGVIDSATMKGVEEVEEIRRRTEESLRRYVDLARRLGLAADWRMSVGTEAVAEAERLCLEVGREFPRAVFFAGKLVFKEERWFQRLLHNETGYVLQRRLQFAGLNTMVLPVRVLEAA